MLKQLKEQYKEALNDLKGVTEAIYNDASYYQANNAFETIDRI